MLCLLRVLKIGLAVATGLGTPGLAWAQGTDYAAVKGAVTVWVVTPSTAADKARSAARKLALARTPPTTVQESTTADFGQPSSNVGQTAGSYGTPSANVGRSASDTGQTAGSYGQTSGSLGGPASNTGQTAGSYGQTSGSYGQSAGSYGQAVSTYGGGNAGVSNAETRKLAVRPIRSLLMDSLAGHGSPLLPDLVISFVDVTGDELRESLLRARGTEAYPDVLAGVLPSWWDESGLGLAMLGSLRFLDVTASEFSGNLGRDVRAVVLARAPHPEAARAYVLLLRDVSDCPACSLRAKRKEFKTPVEVAVSAVTRVLHGSALGAAADEAAAEFNAELAQRMALMPMSDEALAGLESLVEVLDAGANERLAVVSVRVVMASAAAFGAVRAVVVLRKDVRGHWRVLQISAGVPPVRMGSAGGDLLAYTKAVPPEKVAHVVGISQASPIDGDARPPRPELWWDNGGGADMQVVEWQRKTAAAWTATRLLLAPDDSFRVRTQVTANFADAGGEYRWRVWSVGVGGVMVISLWRRLTILP